MTVIKRVLLTIFCLPFFAACAEPYLTHIEKSFKNSFDDPVWYVGAALIPVIHLWDDDVQHNLKNRLMPDAVSTMGDYYGKGLNYGAACLFIWLEGAATGKTTKHRWQNIQSLSEAYAATLLVTEGLKYSVRRMRPDGSDRLSFPSGHTSGSFAVAMVLQELYGYRVGIPAFTLAGVTGLQRIHANKHWLTDVLAGALLGSMIGKGFVELDVKGEKKGILFHYSVAF
jgi:hypothetical protein